MTKGLQTPRARHLLLRVLTIPLEWYPRLRDASSRDLDEWRLIGGGIGIHWPSLDEDISVAELLGGSY
ncbi:MAG: DUF2442 domain-containing protein [Rectinemataceae bacterium]